MLSSLINPDILHVERETLRICECCGLKYSEFLYLYKTDRVTVLSHVCSNCKNDLIKLETYNEKYSQFINKTLIGLP